MMVIKTKNQIKKNYYMSGYLFIAKAAGDIKYSTFFSKFTSNRVSKNHNIVIFKGNILMFFIARSL